MNLQYLTPVLTIFQKDGKTLDPEGNQKLHDYLIQGGVDGLVLMGSTGEFYTMTMETQKQMIDLAARTLKDRTRVFIGAGRLQIDETVELCNYAAEKGLEEVMIVSPYYFHLTQKSLEAYYSEVASRTSARIFLYNYPDRTHHDLSPQLVLRLAQKHENIVGIKDTVSNVSHTSDILSLVRPVRPEFEVYSGGDDNLLHMAMSGGNGCIGALSNMMPERCAAWTQAIRSGDIEKAAAFQKYFNDAMAIYQITTPFISGLKYSLRLRHLDVSDTCSAPLLPPTDYQKADIEALLKKLELI